MTSAPQSSELQRLRRFALPAVALLFIALSIWLLRLDVMLRNDVAPNGIVSFELAGTGERAQAMIDSWSPSAREAVMLIQGLDYLYLLVYPAFLSLLCFKLAARIGGAWGRAGASLGSGVWLCAPFDAVENQALIAQVMHGASDELARRAYLAAVPKFLFFTIAVAFVLAAGTVAMFRRGGRAV